MADARTHGTVAQNAELAAAVSVDSLVDLPVWGFNKLFGTKVAAPLHLASDVYDAQTAGLFTDAAGNPLDQQAIDDATAAAEAQGGIIDAGIKTAKDAADHPLSLIPTWALVLGAFGVVVAVGYYAIMARAALRAA